MCEFRIACCNEECETNLRQAVRVLTLPCLLPLQYAQSTILDIFTPDDLRVLVESLDEDSRRGNFQRVMPSPTSHKYLHYFEQPRYSNLLLDAWVHRYHRIEARGTPCSTPYNYPSHCNPTLNSA